MSGAAVASPASWALLGSTKRAEKSPASGVGLPAGCGSDQQALCAFPKGLAADRRARRWTTETSAASYGRNVEPSRLFLCRVPHKKPRVVERGYVLAFTR